MIISTTQPIRPCTKTKSVRGFTLVEVLIGSSLGAFVLVGVLSSFLMLGRSGTNIAFYTEMEAQIRRSLETFSQDLRMANNVTWNNATSITMTVPQNYTGAIPVNTVTYAYDSGAQNFYFVPGNDAAATAGKTVLLRNITNFAFSRYNRLDSAATTDVETKRIQLSLTARNTARTVVGSSQSAISASYILRNKIAN